MCVLDVLFTMLYCCTHNSLFHGFLQLSALCFHLSKSLIYFSFVKDHVKGKLDWVVRDDLLSRFSRGLCSEQLQNKRSKHVTSARVYLSCFYFLSLFAQSPTGYLWLYCTLRRFKSFLVCHNKVLMFPSRKSSCKKSMVNKLLCKRSVLIELRLIVAQLILSLMVQPYVSLYR